MIIYPGSPGQADHAIYFDNEGHTIEYTIAYQAPAIVFTSGKSSNTPIFRLSYTPLDSNTVNVKFEMSRDGETFVTYIEGNSRKK